MGDKDADAEGVGCVEWRDVEGIEGMGNGEGVSPPSRLYRGSGERRKLPSGVVRGGDPTENEFGAVWSCQKATGGNHFEYSAVHVFALD